MNPNGYRNCPPPPLLGQNWLRRENVPEFGQVERRNFQSNEINHEMHRRSDRNDHNCRTKGWKNFDYRRYNRRGFDLDDIWRPNYDDDDDDDDDDNDRVRSCSNWNPQYPYNNRNMYEYPNNYPYQHATPTWYYSSYPHFTRHDTYRNYAYRNRPHHLQQSDLNNSLNSNIVDTQNRSQPDMTSDSSNRSDGIDRIDSVMPITDHSKYNKILDNELIRKLESLHGKNATEIAADVEHESELLPNLEGPMLNLMEVLSDTNNNNNNASSNIAGTIADTHKTIDIISQSNKSLQNTSTQQKRYNNINLTTIKKNCSFLPECTRESISKAKVSEVQTSVDNLKQNTSTTVTIQPSSIESEEVVNLQSNNEELTSSNENVLVTDNVNSNVNDRKHSCKEAVSHTTDAPEIIVFNNHPVVNHSLINKSPCKSPNQNNSESIPDQGDEDCKIIFLRKKLQLKSQKMENSNKHISNGTQTSSDKLIKKQGLNAQAVSVSETFISDSSVHSANSKQSGKSDVSVLNSSSSKQNTSNPSSEHSSCSAPMQNSHPPVEGIGSKVNHNTKIECDKNLNGNSNVWESKTTYRKISRQEGCENSVDIHNTQGKHEHKKHSDKTHCHPKKPTKPLNDANTTSITHRRKHSKTAEEPEIVHINENPSESNVNNNQLVLSKERGTCNSSSNKNNTKSTASGTSPIVDKPPCKISKRRKTIAHVSSDSHVVDNGGTPENGKQLEMVHHKKTMKTFYDADIYNSHIKKRRKTVDESQCVKLNEKIEFRRRENDSESNTKETLLLEKKTGSCNKNKEPSVAEKITPLKTHKRRKTISEWSIESAVNSHHYPSSSKHKKHLSKRNSCKSSNEGSSNEIELIEIGDVDSSVVKCQSVPLEGDNDSNKTNEDSIAPVAKKVPVLKIHKLRHTITQQVEDNTGAETTEQHKEEIVASSISHKTGPDQIQARRNSIIVSPDKDDTKKAKKVNRLVSRDSTELPIDSRSKPLIESDSDSDPSIITCRSSSSEREAECVQPQPYVLIENCLAGQSSCKSQHHSNRQLASKTCKRTTDENVMIPLKEYVPPSDRKSKNKPLNKSRRRNSKFIQLFGSDSDDDTSSKSHREHLKKKSSRHKEPDIPWKLQKVDDYILSIKHALKSTCEEVHFETTIEVKANDKLETAKCNEVEAELDTSASLIIAQGKVYSETVIIKQPSSHDSEIERVKEINNLMQLHCTSSSATIESNSKKFAEEVVCTPDILNSENCSPRPASIQPSPTLTWDHNVSAYNPEQLNAKVAERSVSRKSCRLGNIKITPLRKQISTNIATSTSIPSTAQQVPNFKIMALYDDFSCEFWKEILCNLRNSEMIVKQRNYFCKIGYNIDESNASLSNYRIAWVKSIEGLGVRILNFFSKHTIPSDFSYKVFLKYCFDYINDKGYRITLPSLVKLMTAVVSTIKNGRSNLDGFITNFSAMADEEYNNNTKKMPTQLDTFLISCNLSMPAKPRAGNAGECSSTSQVAQKRLHDATPPPANENELPEDRAVGFTSTQRELLQCQLKQYCMLMSNHYSLINVRFQQRRGIAQQEQEQLSYSSPSSCRFQPRPYASQRYIPPPSFPSQSSISHLRSLVRDLGYDSSNINQNHRIHIPYIVPPQCSSISTSSDQLLQEITDCLQTTSPISDARDNFRIRLPLSVPRTEENTTNATSPPVLHIEESATSNTPPNTPEIYPLSATEIPVKTETAGVNNSTVIESENPPLSETTTVDHNKDIKNIVPPIFPFEENEVIDVDQWFLEKMRQQDFIDLDDYDMDMDPNHGDVKRMDVVPNEGDVKQMIVNPDVLEGERFCICSNKAQLVCLCGLAIYCSQKCQNDDWCNHRSICTSTRQGKSA